MSSMCFITDTSRHGWTIVWVDMITIFPFCYVYNTNFLCYNTTEVLSNEVKKTEVTKFHLHTSGIRYITDPYSDYILY